MTTLGYIILGIIAALLAFFVAVYNGLVSLRVRVEEAWSDIDVQLKRRHDLIPNLVETVKGYATHERETFDEVMRARAEATAVHVDASGVDAQSLAALAGAEAGLSGALGRLMAVAENYPDLKASENFVELQRSLEDTEDKIQASRRFYNGVVRDYNTKIEVIPSNIVAGMFKFTKKEFFDLDETPEQRENVNVDFGSSNEK